MAASAEKKAAVGAEIGAGFDFAAALGTLFTPAPGGGGGPSPPGGGSPYYGGSVEG